MWYANCVKAKFSSCGNLLDFYLLHGVFTNYMLLVITQFTYNYKYKLVNQIGFQLNMLNGKMMNLYICIGSTVY